MPLVWKGGTSGFVLEGRPRDDSLLYDANNRTVSAGYMETIGMTLQDGRFFDAHDDERGQPVAIVNETMARQYWPGLNPIGRRFHLSGADKPWRTIVGVVGDTRSMGIEQPTRAEMYFPIAQSRHNWMWPRDLAIRTEGDPHAVVASASAAVWAVDPAQPISNVQTMDEIVDHELQTRTMQTTLMTAFAGLALLLAAVGVYGVLAYSVSERTAEIGIRLALGSEPGRVRRLVVGRGARLAATGLAIGLLGAFWGVALLGGLLYGVAPHNAGVFVSQAAILAFISLAAAYIPARRAAAIDPVDGAQGGMRGDVPVVPVVPVVPGRI